MSTRLITAIVKDVAELPDRNSPEGQPEMMLVSHAELTAILDGYLNKPQTAQFLQAVAAETIHQVERWGTVHDRAKAPADWFWLIGYLAGKALHAHAAGDREKALHHCVSSAAALASWWTHITLGCGEFTPGASDLQRFIEEQFGEGGR